MKIGLIAPGFSASQDDWCIPALVYLVRELTRRHEVHVLSLRYPHRRAVYDVHGARVHALGYGTRAGFRRLPLLTRALGTVIQENRRRPFDVLHGLWADEPGSVAVAAGRLLKKPAVVSLAGGELVGFRDIGYGGQLSRANRRLTAWSLRHAHQITAGSRYLARLASAHAAADRLLVLPLGLDLSLFRSDPPDVPPSPLELQSQRQLDLLPYTNGTSKAPANSLSLAGSIKLLQVASLVPVKDQTTLLEAMARLASQRPGVHLHLVGEGPQRAALQRQAHDLGLARQVSFHGAIPHHRLAQFYRSADLFVLSSRFESQAMVVLEAAACGCPAAGTAVGLLPELSPPGWVAPVGDADALATALLTALEDRRKLDAQAQASPLAVEEAFTVQHTVAQLEQLYARLVAGP